MTTPKLPWRRSVTRSARLLSLSLLAPLALASCTAQAPAPASSQAIGEALLAYDRALPLNAEVKEKSVEGGVRLLSVSYSSTHGERVPALLALPAEAKSPLPCIVLMHGLGGSKEGMKPFWVELTKAGYACFAIDAVFHGERPKGPGGQALLLYPYSGRDALAQTVIDLRRGLDFLQTRDEIDPKRIGYVGLSMGAILGSITAGVDERIAAVALIVGGGDWNVLLEKSVLSLAGDKNLKDKAARAPIATALDPLDPVHWVGHISPRPVLMINGDLDNIVPVESNKALHTAAKEPKKVVWYSGGHFPPPDLVRRELLSWFADHLSSKP